MFYHTYENVDRIIVGVHVESQEELDEMLGENRELEYFMCLCYVACGLYELEHYHGIEPIIEMYMTYYIYQYEHFGKYKDMLYDYDLLEKDIAKIKSIRKLKFERLKCYEE